MIGVRISGFGTFKVLSMFVVLVLAVSLPFCLQRIRDSKVTDAKAGELRGVFTQWQRAGSPTGEALQQFIRERPPLKFMEGQSVSVADGSSISGLFAITNLPGIADSLLLVDQSGKIFFSRSGQSLSQYWP